MILTTTLLSYFFLSLVIALGLCQLRREAARCIQEAVDEVVVCLALAIAYRQRIR